MTKLAAPLFALLLLGQASPETKIRKAELRATLTKLGYEPKELGNGVYEVETLKGKEKIFVSVSISPSENKIWLTGTYGVLTDREKQDPEFLLSLLEKNGEIQPAHFYVRRGKLNIGIPVDNKQITAASLNKEINGFADVVVKTKPFWERKE